MDEAVARDVVARLRDRSVFAHVNRRAGVYSVGIRVVLPDSREAIWDNDGASGLEAMVLRDGDLVGFVPQIEGSDDLTAEQIAHIIGATDYDAPAAATPSHPTRSPVGVGSGSLEDADVVPVPGTGATAGLVDRSGGWLGRLRRRTG